MAKLPVNFAEVPNGTDVKGMRRWIDEVFLQGPMAECRAKCDVERRQPIVPVDVGNVLVPCAEGGQAHFTVRVYDPQIQAAEGEAQSRPAIIMLHGGGWIHGNPLGDEGAWSAVCPFQLPMSTLPLTPL
jgi:acetyl esterase/lipase